jgi:hypothetical protein
MINFILRKLSYILRKKEYNVNVKFYVGHIPNEKSDKICEQFLDYVYELGFDSCGSFSCTEANLTIYSDKKITKENILQLKSWLYERNINEYS